MFKKLVTAAAILLGIAHTSAQAQVIDLTTGGSGSSQAGIDFYTTSEVQPAGSGVLHSFVRIQSPAGSDKSITSGYNTDGRDLQYDENTSSTFTRSLLLSDIPTVTINDVVYREFVLDINQRDAFPLLSLNEVQIFTTADRYLLGAQVATNGDVSFGGNATPIYSLDALGDYTVELKYDWSGAGSGRTDMYLYVADSRFQTGDNYVVLYSKFGHPNANNDGYEEWAVQAVPEPASIVMTLMGMLPLGYVGLRRRLRRKSEAAA